MKKLSIIIVLLFLFLTNGCHTHFHVSPTFSPNTVLNTKSDSVKTKKDSVTLKKVKIKKR